MSDGTELVDVEKMTEAKDASEMKPNNLRTWRNIVAKVDKRWLEFKYCSMSHPKQNIRRLAIAIAMAFG